MRPLCGACWTRITTHGQRRFRRRWRRLASEWSWLTMTSRKVAPTISACHHQNAHLHRLKSVPPSSTHIWWHLVARALACASGRGMSRRNEDPHRPEPCCVSGCCAGWRPRFGSTSSPSAALARPDSPRPTWVAGSSTKRARASPWRRPGRKDRSGRAPASFSGLR